ncbi:UDP-N-acetylglucosamine 2-epimerase [Pseudobacteroides cellulosolvens]|uniref:UDP-N-acetyl-D-glucosamine 2-epimerase, UDP-hydrolysing n=1 Tax=Pseudobacteroides cellulosolvens ATCC 35603 = DSM 2933 TaxID=398512 RepID=A0A0L6JSB6_9FIRM|nr:UDP-N-acetylglucosamine 2-epimerase [Pseudobacteroides cellulosolvens]KNY28620.1 UDP-N-acetyl-D-glucosamine 2-epimerase, UDP-hydrolysing [Pseudobacteroides cellulosolvens ATCC 35603 = DSM 2933]
MIQLETAVVTTSRADYGLLYPLINKLFMDSFFNIKLIVTGSHLSSVFGNTIDQIINDGFTSLLKVQTYNGRDDEKGITAAVAKGIIGFSDLFSKKRFDLIIVLGDRYELWSVVVAAVIHKIPIIHIHGGESTEGSTDEVVRHSVTKSASIHFPSISQYARRIIAMGENPERVFTVGALGIDNIKNSKLMEIDELSESLGVDFKKGVAIMTFHPVTMDNYNAAAAQVKELLDTLTDIGIYTIMTMPNADAGGNSIYMCMEDHVKRFPDKFKIAKNMGSVVYLSAMRHAHMMIGNSSSGIIESASFKLPVVNIGDRQAGRLRPENVIDCSCNRASIKEAVKKALSKEFIKGLENVTNPYGDGNTADKIIKILKEIDFGEKEKLLKKKFYDI